MIIFCCVLNKNTYYDVLTETSAHAKYLIITFFSVLHCNFIIRCVITNISKYMTCKFQ